MRVGKISNCTDLLIGSEKMNKIQLTDKSMFNPNKFYKFVTYVHELNMGQGSQNYFWLFYIFMSWEVTDLQFFLGIN